MLGVPMSGPSIHPPRFSMETQRLISILQSTLSTLSDQVAASKCDSDVFRTFATAQAAFGALEASLIPPEIYIFNLSLEYTLSVVLGVAVDLGLAELVSASGKSGISSKVMEERTGVPWGKLSRILRLLAGRGIFKEVRPDIWSHTIHSRALDSGLTYGVIVAEPLKRYNQGSALAVVLPRK